MWNEGSDMSDVNTDNGMVKFDALQNENVVLHKCKAGVEVVMTVDCKNLTVSFSYVDSQGADALKSLVALHGPWIPFFQYERKDGVDLQAMQWGYAEL